MSRIVIMGPPGVGKGTQASRLAAELGVAHITTGQMLRDEIDRGTHLGRNLAHTVSAGEYVSDAITAELLRARLAARDALDGFVLDGYPRTAAQVAALDAMLERRGQSVDVVLLLEADERILLSRVAGRAADGRADDRPEVAQHRLALYRTTTAPIVAAYDDRGLVRRIDAARSRDAVAADIADLISAPAGLL